MTTANLLAACIRDACDSHCPQRWMAVQSLVDHVQRADNATAAWRLAQIAPDGQCHPQLGARAPDTTAALIIERLQAQDPATVAATVDWAIAPGGARWWPLVFGKHRSADLWRSWSAWHTATAQPSAA